MTNSLGIDDKTRARDWPYLTEKEVIPIVNAYGLSAAIDTISWHSPRPFSSAGLIKLTNGTQLFLKRQSLLIRSPQSLQQEHNFISHLVQKNFPVLQPLKNKNESTITVTKEWVYELFPPLPGRDLYRDTISWEPYHSEAQSFSAGQLLAQLHKASASYKCPPKKDCLLLSTPKPLLSSHLKTSLESWIETQPHLAAILENWPWQEELFTYLEPFHAQLRPFFSSITPLWGHGDWHGSNLAWKNDQAIMAFDFGLSDQSFAAFDIAIAIERSFIRWVDIKNPKAVSYDLLSAFLKGYTLSRPLTKDERTLIKVSLPLAHIAFALSEISYYGFFLNDQAGAEIAYKKYLIGHLKWFLAKDGQSCLSHLETILNSLPSTSISE
ncbi:phosphotransferase [Aristophania vespae]|uniref:Phosphotransferase n=1 Tax=Aristophania vespae TaxID=2697033 RepID=A0A6P1NF27_9PROT|nr:phosphotransferase [Aristophania vespae]QHI95034.1 phosphotransferase [Aristophania vespae]